MFKKLKDKFAEEMKQSPARLQASMQQLAQAVVSPAQSNSSIQELSMTAETNEPTKEIDEAAKNNPMRSTFQNVELVSPPSNSIDQSRRSSVSSITSDVASLFPIYESPKNLYHIQSDVDQSATEIDDNISTQLDRVTKDQLYLAYKKTQAKYHKYRGRYTDLVTHYRDLERVKTKLESILGETQDNVLRRIGDLKEQCQLEQQAKAHLEEVLRNDIEEKNHIIDTLNTKIKLLQGNVPTSENLMMLDNDEGQNGTVNVMEPKKESTDNENEKSAIAAENTQLKNKLIKLETVLLKYKDSLKRCKDKVNEVSEDKNKLKRDYEALKSSSLENAEILQKELSTARDEILNLTEQVNTLRKREEESVISLAENKLSIHRELEGKEEQIKQLQSDLKHMMDSKENLTQIIEKYKKELEQLKIQYNVHNFDPDAKNNSQDTLKGGPENIENDNILKRSDSLNENEILEKFKYNLTEKEAELQKIKMALQESQTLSTKYQCDKEKLQNELSNLKIKYTELKKEHDAQIIIANERREEAEATIEKLQMTVQSLDRELENMRNALSDRDQVCETFNLKIQEYVSSLEKAYNKLSVQDLEIKKLKDQLCNKNEVSKLQNTLENKDVELTELYNKIKYYENTISELTQQVNVNSSKIDLLNQEKICFKNKIIYFITYVEELKKDCAYLKNNVKEIFQDQNKDLCILNKIINNYLQNTSKEKESFKNETEVLYTKLKTSEQQTIKLAEAETELIHMKQQQNLLEHKLKEHKTKVEQMKMEVKCHNELNSKINILIAEIDSLNFKIHDLQKMQISIKKNKQDEVKHMKDTTEKLKDLEKKYENALNTIKVLECKKSECNLLEEEIKRLKSEILYLKNDYTNHNIEIKELNEKILNKESEIANLQMKCQSHVKLLEEYTEKNLELEKIYQQSNKDHMEETTKLSRSNSTLQETINTRNAQLKKLKIIKEQQNKTIQEVTTELDKLRGENVDMSQTMQALSKKVEILQDENNQLKTLKTENASMNIELTQLKSITDQINEENRNLNVKQSELIQSHKKLNEINEELNKKVLDYEKNTTILSQNIKEVQKDLESYKHKLFMSNDEMENKTVQLKIINEKMDSQTEVLQKRNEELQKIKEEFAEQTQKLNDKNVALNLALEDVQLLQQEKNMLSTDIMKLEEEVTNLKAASFKKIPFKHVNDKLTNIQIEKLKNEELILDEHLANLSASTVLSLDAENKKLTAEIKNIKSIMEQKTSEVQILEAKEKDLLEENEKLKSFNMKELEQKIQEIDILRSKVKEQKNKINELQSQVESLTNLTNNLNSKLQTADNNKTIERDFVEKSNKLEEENKKLEAHLDEALITFQAKESQMQMINTELKNQTDQLKEELKMHEEEQNIRLKQLVKEFQAQLQDKEEELQSALEKRFDYQQSYESNLLQQYKEQLKDFQVELTTKSEQIENLILENKRIATEKENEIKTLTDTVASIKKEHVNELREIEQKWKTILQQRSDKLEAKHEEEIKELTREWKNERKLDTKIDTATEELENTSCIAMATIQSNTGSFHTFQQTLASQNRELAELRKLVKLRHETLEDSTEIEYLRNILYEYMMGRETMVLAKVIAAVVKFDQEQTTKILKKEEDKLTLLGSLGLT
ncbi:hypothetical protein KPH14_002751 [Odynerus spinipes]|uniref:GRIP domain-containing protein n=1 Tax=Odynerus spinipes TaxID=1348599 RepID=A0AAD9VP85_9HYME|nr:hypothetical protein KPH14_002751 [Odynerus spinipes]